MWWFVDLSQKSTMRNKGVIQQQVWQFCFRMFAPNRGEHVFCQNFNWGLWKDRQDQYEPWSLLQSMVSRHSTKSFLTVTRNDESVPSCGTPGMLANGGRAWNDPYLVVAYFLIHPPCTGPYEMGILVTYKMTYKKHNVSGNRKFKKKKNAYASCLVIS